MNYSELLHDFLDGALDGGQQETLFLALAQDAELRSEMQHLLRLKRAVQSDTEAFTPPPEAKEAIFAQLGFRTAPVQSPQAIPPQSLPSQNIPAPVAAKPHGFLWREILLSSLATSLTTALLFFFFLRPSGSSVFNDGSNAGNGAIPPMIGQGVVASNGEPSGVPMIASTESLQTRDTVQVLREVVHHYHGEQSSSTLQRELSAFQAMMLSLTRELRSALQDAQEENKRLREERTAFANTALATSSTDRIKSASAATSSEAAIIKPSTSETQASAAQTPVLPNVARAVVRAGDWYNNLSIGVRGYRSMSLPQTTIASNAEKTFFPNAAISALYRISAHEEIGLEGGQEAYFQQFRSVNAEGIPFIIEQNPMLSWAGVAYRYTLFPESMLSPFLHIVLGGADVGLTGRAMLGLRFAPDSRTQFLLGAESSALIYGHQGRWYATPNVGFNYGVSIRF